MATTTEATIDEGTVARLAALAELELDVPETRELAVDLARILDHFRALSTLDLDALDPPLAEASADPQEGLRADTPCAELARDVLLGAAPRSEDGGFAVPTFVDEG